MSEYEIVTVIVCSISGFICYLIGYRVGITHDKRTITHECVKDTHDKTEPQTNADQHVQRVEYVGNDEKSRCWKCKHFERMHETPISSDGSYYIYVVCTSSKCHYEPKTEPQTERSE